MTIDEVMTSPTTVVMGILNVTPDSFSDGGRWAQVDEALDRAQVLIDQGAHVIDVGGESTRPGSTRITSGEELNRIREVVRALVADGRIVSVDTVNSRTAREVADLGVDIINDVSGGCWDPQMISTVADTGVHVIVQHWRGFPGTDGERLMDVDGVVNTMLDELSTQVARFIDAGVDPQRIITDPGLGFGKNETASWRVLTAVDRLRALGYPVLIGASRKRMTKSLVDMADPLIPDRSTIAVDSDEVSAAITALVASRGVWAVRVHEPRAHLAAIRAATCWRKECARI